MLAFLVSHLIVICLDFVVTMATQQRNFFKVSDLLVVKKIKELSKLTSDPMRVKTLLENHMGTQNYHQHELGKMWFMKSLLGRNIFPHEIQVTAKKTLYGFKWREANSLDPKIVRQCRSIIEVRMNICTVNMKHL